MSYWYLQALFFLLLVVDKQLAYVNHMGKSTHGRYYGLLQCNVDGGNEAAAPTAPKPPRAPRAVKDKYRTKDLLRSAEGVPVGPLKASRPSLYKPTPVSGFSSSGGSGKKRIMDQGKPREQEISNPNRLRIIAGTAKGKKIDSPDVYLRPMMAKVREALFSTLGHVGIFDANVTRVLDVFSGSGSVGLEALSRGAKHCTFVDMSSDCTSTALRNAVTCGFEGRATAVTARAEDVLNDPKRYGLVEPYGLISITPPYEEVVYQQLIDAVCSSPLVCEDTLVVIEYPVEMGTLPQILGRDKLFGIRNRKYGRTVLGLYVYRPSKQYDMRPAEFERLT